MKSKVKVTNFQNRPRYCDDQKTTGKILNRKCKKKLKPKFWMFQGQFDFEDQGNDNQVLNLFKTFIRPIHGSSLKVKFEMIQKLSCSQEITDDGADDVDGTKTKMCSQDGERHNWLLGLTLTPGSLWDLLGH